MKHLTERKSFRIDERSNQLLKELTRHSLGTESTLIRKYVIEGILRDGSSYAAEVQQVIEATETLKKIQGGTKC